jgi:ABC-type glycerol-3-phosphate transport system permease component
MSTAVARRMTRAKRDLPVHAALLIPMVSIVFLLYYLVENTLKPQDEFYHSDLALPQHLSFSALGRAMHEGGMLLALRNSAILTSASTFLAVLLGAFAAYAFSRLRLPWKYPVFIAMLIPMSISPMIVMIPLFAQLSQAGLVDTFAGGILIYVGLQLSFSIYVLESIFRELPDELFEAARIDGAGEVRVFLRILLPMAAPGLVAVALIVMIEIWNDLLVGLLFLPDPSVIPISANVVTYQQKFSTDPQLIFAGLFLAAAPMLLVYLVAQRYFIRGLMGGAFK